MPLHRRQFLAAASAALVGSTCGLRRLLAQTPGQAPPQTAFTPLRRNVGIFTGQGGTIGWLAGEKGALVIDSQFPVTARVCLDGIKERTGGRVIDYLVNTHHHGDHTAGNGVFQPAVRKILAHANVPKLQREAAERAAASAAPGAPAPAPQVYATATYVNVWRDKVGGDTMAVRYYGPAHTSGDSVVTIEKANVVHMGDLVFNRRHPYIDRAAGSSVAGWMKLLEQVASDHENDTIYVFGHAGAKFDVTGRKADLAHMRSYLAALQEHVGKEIKAGKGREEIVKSKALLEGFADLGRLAEFTLSGAYDEVAG